MRMMVVYDEGNGGGSPHALAFRWFRVGENADAPKGLSAASRISLYGNAVYGIPRHVLSLLRRDLLEDPAQAPPSIWNTFYKSPNIARNLGTLTSQLTFDGTSTFSEFTPQTPAMPSEVRIFSQDTRNSFSFSGPPLPPYQLHFARKLAQVCQEHGTRLVFLNLPQFVDERETRVPEREYWPDALGRRSTLSGSRPQNCLPEFPATT